MNRREEILGKIPTIKALPTSAAHVVALLQDPDVGIADVMQLVEVDPALTADILRLANSAYFAGPRKISSLRDAGVLLGTKRLMQLVMASAIFPLAQNSLQGYDLPSGQLLQNLVAAAIGAEELAKELGITAPPHTFTAAILHDIGKIVLGTFVEVDTKPIMELAFQEKVSFEVAEQRVLGIDHPEVGAALLESWGIPDEVVQVVRWHHQPENFPGEDTLALDLIHVADHLSMECGIGVGLDGLNYHTSAAVIERLKLTTTMTERVIARMLAGLSKMQAQIMGNGGS